MDGVQWERRESDESKEREQHGAFHHARNSGGRRCLWYLGNIKKETRLDGCLRSGCAVAAAAASPWMCWNSGAGSAFERKPPVDESAGIVHLKEGKSKARWRIFSLFRGLPISAVEEEGEEEGSEEKFVRGVSKFHTNRDKKEKKEGWELKSREKSPCLPPNLYDLGLWCVPEDPGEASWTPETRPRGAQRVSDGPRAAEGALQRTSSWKLYAPQTYKNISRLLHPSRFFSLAFFPSDRRGLYSHGTHKHAKRRREKLIMRWLSALWEHLPESITGNEWKGKMLLSLSES